jgi:hypothetical protein
MNEVTIYSGDTYHVFFFEGDTLIEVHMSCTKAHSRVLDRCYLEDQKHPLVSLPNGMYICIPIGMQELQAVAQEGGYIKLFADDLYSIEVLPMKEIEEGFIKLFYNA